MPRWIMPVRDGNDAPPLTFGQALKADRLARGLSQEEVAEAIHVRQSKISEYELDRKGDPPLMIVAALEDFFGRERGDYAVLLWGERVRKEMRKMFGRAQTYAIAENAPEDLYGIIEDISTLDAEDITNVKRMTSFLKDVPPAEREEVVSRFVGKNGQPGRFA